MEKAMQDLDEQEEYHAYVDGKPRMEGVRSFPRARGIELSTEEQEQLARNKEAQASRPRPDSSTPRV